MAAPPSQKTRSSPVQQLPSSTTHHPVLVVSFDLDNTLWRTGPTLQAANAALASWIDENASDANTTTPLLTVEEAMQQLMRENRSKYCATSTGGPVHLTQLRRDAIRRVLASDRRVTEETMDEGMRVWSSARHAAIPNHAAANVAYHLQRLRQGLEESRFCCSIGAITDGNSDPRAVRWPDAPSIEWDFVLSAEHVGVGKPDPRVYQRAVEMVREQQQEDIPDTVGQWWVHVGDDFLKDVVGARTLGMRSIWVRELLGADKVPTPPSPRERPYEEFLRDTAGKKVIPMNVGADDYLADGLEREFADATVDTFGEVVDTILQWHHASQSGGGVENGNDTNAIQDPPVALESSISISDGVEALRPDFKFCIHCGEKLPQQALFCSKCGKPQEEVK